MAFLYISGLQIIVLLYRIPGKLRAGFNESNSYFGLLGLNWDTMNDSFPFNINVETKECKITKREVPV